MTESIVRVKGINDADYNVSERINGKTFICPFYRTWSLMLVRCYSIKFQEAHQTYVGCKVCDEWLTFSNFKRWMEMQIWKGMTLDKDIIKPGNKVYSPDTCAFVSRSVNNFVIDSGASRGMHLIGASYNKPCGKFTAKCRNPFTGKNENLGYFESDKDAHLAWKRRKREIANLIADNQSDHRVADALRCRYK